MSRIDKHRRPIAAPTFESRLSSSICRVIRRTLHLGLDLSSSPSQSFHSLHSKVTDHVAPVINAPRNRNSILHCRRQKLGMLVGSFDLLVNLF